MILFVVRVVLLVGDSAILKWVFTFKPILFLTLEIEDLLLKIKMEFFTIPGILIGPTKLTGWAEDLLMQIL
ncbi:hypothetical protein CJU81_05895 [Pseudomonas fragi]|uniref:Uncharacterized protein n=1 Tax=Pseudomonas fragi TaxID=296 RepID=A0A267AQY7_PSEFR|nr:hypothetical protein CJU81_05895 [Pseudomonas fragi]